MTFVKVLYLQELRTYHMDFCYNVKQEMLKLGHNEVLLKVKVLLYQSQTSDKYNLLGFKE